MRKSNVPLANIASVLCAFLFTLSVERFPGDSGKKLPQVDKLVRQATTLAFESYGCIKRFRNGRGSKVHSPVPPGFTVYDPKFRDPLAEHNVLRNEKLLVDASGPWGTGLPVFEYESLWSWLGSSLPRSASIFMAFNSRNISFGPNAANFVSAEFDRLYGKSLTLNYSPARDAIYRELRDFINLILQGTVTAP